MKHGCFAVG